MNINKFKLYGEFEKVTDNEDGTLTVSGIASSEAVDSDGETITADAMKAAIPDYMAFGALREMHTAWAAGTAIKCEVGSDNRTYFEALVVDAEACKKVQTGTYKGFSIGGKVTKRDPLKKSTITGIKLVEVSLVDRPANPEAVFSMGKVEGDEPELQTLGTLRKGLWTVADFASVLQSLAWMAQGTEDEAEYEGDASPIPGAFGEWVTQGLGLLQAMAAEEIAELVATLPKPEPQAALAMAAKAAGVDLEKAGKKFSKATAEALGKVHGMIGDCQKAVADLGFDKADNVEEDDPKKAEDAGALQKAISAAITGFENTDPVASIQALVGAKDALAQKAEGLSDDLAKALATNEALTKRVAELEAMPVAAKGVAVVIDADKQSEMLGKAMKDAESEDLRKYQEEADEEAKYRLALKFTHRWGHKPS